MKADETINLIMSARLTRSIRLMVFSVGAGLWLTGVLWLVFHHFLQQ